MKHPGLQVISLLLSTFAVITPFASEALGESLPVGEKIRYSIVAEGIKVGNQTIEVSALTEKDGREAYLIEGRSTTSTLLSVLYRLDDKWDIYMDRSTLYPFRVEKDWVEGKDKGYYVYEIDQAGGLIRHLDLSSGKVKTLTPKNPVFDLFSLVYFYRSKADSLPDPFIFDFLETKSVQTVRFKDQGEEEIVIFAISPHKPCRVRKLKQVGGLGVEIFIGVDEPHLPLKLLTPAKLSRKKTIEIEFVIDGYSPGLGQGETPHEYRRLKY
jgi:hypothetical protein